MNRLRIFLCASFAVIAHQPSLLHAQLVAPEVPRSSVSTELRLVIPPMMRVYSLDRTQRGPVSGLWRGWLQDSARRAQPVPVVLPSDSTVTAMTSNLECPMPVARLAPVSVPHMPTAQTDSLGTAPRAVTLRGCTNPLDRKP